jgi:hypothetical protein
MDTTLQEEVSKAFVGLVADVIDSSQFGRKIAAGGGGIRSHRGETKRSWMLHQLRRINEAIGAARNLGVLSESVVKFSGQELTDLRREIWDYQALEMYPKIKERILALLRERFVPEELLEEISTTADAMTSEVRLGIWAPH